MGLQKYRADSAGSTQDDGAIPWYADWMGGPSLALVRNCKCENADITPRTVYVSGEPDTWFSIPAACKFKNKRITGYLTTREGNYVFIAHTEQSITYKTSPTKHHLQLTSTSTPKGEVS